MTWKRKNISHFGYQGNLYHMVIVIVGASNADAVGGGEGGPTMIE